LEKEEIFDMHKKITPVLICILMACVSFAGCIQEQTEEISVVCAGSLIQPLTELKKRYESENPGNKVLIEGHGSIQAIRQVTDLNRRFDLIAVADESLIPAMMGIDEYEALGTSEMVLMYTNRSAYADEITSDNWATILARDGIRFGFSNPVLDAAGYRSLMVLALHDRQHGTNLLERVIASQIEGISVDVDQDVTTITLSPILKPKTSQSPYDRQVLMRDGSVFLLTLLKTGGVDYALEYKCVADGADMSYTMLSPHLNLGDPEYASVYAEVVVNLNFQRFSSIGLTRTGLPIVYAAVIPDDAMNASGAEKFLAFLNENRDVLGMPEEIMS
jgi:molybdate/tungstate transport system substrate-binding protein